MINCSLFCALAIVTTNAIEGDDQKAVRPEARRAVVAADVAKLPAPGTVVPGGVTYSTDGKGVEFLLSDSGSLDRVLWRLELQGAEPAKVTARPPGEGTSEANVSLEEALRRERQRVRETGITSVSRASKSQTAVFPIRSNLYLQKDGKGELEQITKTSSPEIDPKLDAEGTRVAFVRDGELYVLDLATKTETKLTEGATEGLTHGLAEFMAQEEMHRSTGFWWSPDGSHIAYQETDERAIPLYTIAHEGGDAFSVETHRYPFPGKANAKVRLGVVAAAGGSTKWVDLASDGDDFYLARVDWEDAKNLLVQVLSRSKAIAALPDQY